MLIQFIGCKCGNNPTNNEGEARSGDTTKQPDEDKPTLILTGPAEVKNNPTALLPTIITLKLEVTNGTLNTNDYSLEAIDLKNYGLPNYTNEQASKNTKVSHMNGVTLQALLTGTPTLTKNDKKDLKISVTVSKWTLYNKGKSNELKVPYSESAEFQFAILDKAGNPVAGPIEVKWTRDIT